MAASMNGSSHGGASTADIIARAQALFDDLSFTSAREWKEAAPDRKVIGYMPIYVPREIIHAAGLLPLGIVGGGDQLEVIHGDAYYQSYICRIPRSTIELGVSGRLDFVDGMLFPSICDVIRNLSGMWKMMFPHVYSRYFDVPQNYRDDIGGNYYVNELAELCTISARCAASRSPTTSLRASIVVYNENRRLVRELYDVPRAAPVAGAGRRGLSRAAGRAGAAGRGAQRNDRATISMPPRPTPTGRRRDNCRVVLTGRVLRAAAAQPDQVAGAGGLLRGRRRSVAGDPLAHRGRADRRRSAAEPGLCLPASFRNRPPPSTSPT